jgi:twitching motility protein PilT
MSQKLLPRIGGGRVPAAEMLMLGYGARQHIRKNALQHLHQEISITRPQGSFTFEESLAALVKSGRVEPDQARGERFTRRARDTSSRRVSRL